MTDEDRKSLLRNLSKTEYDDVMNVCAMMPFVTMDVQTEGT